MLKKYSCGLDHTRGQFWRVAGHFEILRQDPPLIIDSAHNRDSAQKLYNVLENYFPGQEVVLVFGVSEDKDITGMLTELKPGISQVVATKSTHPRAADPGQLVSIANKLSLPAISTESVEEAMDEAEQLSDGKKIILVTGSIFVAAAARSVRLLSESESDTVLIGK